jgi:hypothetical protein
MISSARLVRCSLSANNPRASNGAPSTLPVQHALIRPADKRPREMTGGREGGREGGGYGGETRSSSVMNRGGGSLSPAPVLNGIPAMIYRDGISTGIKSSRGTLDRRESIHRARRARHLLRAMRNSRLPLVYRVCPPFPPSPPRGGG